MTEELRPKRWYVVKAIAGKEKKAKEYIENEVAHSGFEQYVSQVLIPTEKVFSVRNGKRVSKDRTLFPGYVLIEAALEGEIMHAIRNVPNVIGFLTQKDGTPVPLQEDEVKRMGLETKVEIENINFAVGDNVKIVSGPLESFVGVINSLNFASQKANVKVDIFGRDTDVELDFVQIQRIDV